MDARDRLLSAAAADLASRLAAVPGMAPAAPRPGVAEAAIEAPAGGAGPGLDSPALAELARAVVEAVLDLAGRRMEEEALAQAVERAARSHLASLAGAGAGPGQERALLARLAAEAPRLLDLPRLLKLAQSGLKIAPALAAAEEAEPEMVAGASPAFGRVLEQLERVAATDFPVLLLGETGTGKELLARRLHRLSPRREGPLVAINCAALAKGLLESELFGHVKGAFTGAVAPQGGYIRAAEGGSLFLDEIGETTAEFQARLLRVLEDRVVVPVGSARGQRVDFRLITAASRDLGREAREGRFNQALLYRIQVVPISLPPLRERPEDVPALLDHFLARANLLARRTRRLSPGLRQALLSYPWPGNVRELKHLVERLVALSAGFEIGVDELPEEVRAGLGRGESGGFLARLAGVEGVPEKRAAALAGLLAAFAGREITNRDVRESLGCSDSTAKNLLKALVEAGVLQTTGDRGGRRYRVKEP